MVVPTPTCRARVLMRYVSQFIVFDSLKEVAQDGTTVKMLSDNNFAGVLWAINPILAQKNWGGNFFCLSPSRVLDDSERGHIVQRA